MNKNIRLNIIGICIFSISITCNAKDCSLLDGEWEGIEDFQYGPGFFNEQHEENFKITTNQNEIHQTEKTTRTDNPNTLGRSFSNEYKITNCSINDKTATLNMTLQNLGNDYIYTWKLSDDLMSLEGSYKFLNPADKQATFTNHMHLQRISAKPSINSNEKNIASNEHAKESRNSGSSKSSTPNKERNKKIHSSSKKQSNSVADSQDQISNNIENSANKNEDNTNSGRSNAGTSKDQQDNKPKRIDLASEWPCVKIINDGPDSDHVVNWFHFRNLCAYPVGVHFCTTPGCKNSEGFETLHSRDNEKYPASYKNGRWHVKLTSVCKLRSGVSEDGEGGQGEVHTDKNNNCYVNVKR